MSSYTDWRVDYFNNSLCSGMLETDYSKRDSITIKGKLKQFEPNATIMYWAANPPQRGYSYSGSGLPYANPEQAYDRTPNTGAVKAHNGEFQITIKYPSAYYVGLGSLYIEPSIHLKVLGSKDKYETIRLGQGVPYRTLTYPAPPSKNPRIDPNFYASSLPVRSQESILRSSGYPQTYYMPDNFCGLKPPN